MTSKEKKETLLLVDGNALVHRGFHAIPHLSTKTGEPTNGVYGFALLFLNALKDLKPEYVAVSFDLPKPTFRDKLYEEYKGTRVAAPDELYEQIPRVRDLVKAFNVPIYEKAGFEADDVIGTLATQADKAGVNTIILTGDYDTLQLVNGSIKVFAPKKGLAETQIYGEKEVVAKYNLQPEQLIDYKALRGDPSDNIPGVAGIGQKGATELLKKFGDLSSIYEYLKKHPDGGKKMKPRIAELLIKHKKDALLSQKLGEIVRKVPIKFDQKKARLHDFDEQKVVKLFSELEFKSLLTKIPHSKNHNQVNNIDNNKANYQLVDDGRAFAEFLSKIKQQEEFALDTETTSEHPVEADLVGAGFGWEKGQAYYLTKKFALDEKIKKILEDPKIKKVGHNIKYDQIVLKRAGIELRGVSFDSMVGAYLLNPGARAFNLTNLAFTEFGYRMQPIEELIGKGRDQKTMDQVPVGDVCQYCGEDVDFTWRLTEKLEKELKAKKLLKLFTEVELPLISVLAEMEYLGIRVNQKTLLSLSGQGKKEIVRLEKKIYRLAGKEFNIGSPIQLKEVLFDELGISTENLKKGKTGVSTAATELEKLRGQHPIIDLLFEWREVTKLKNTYLDALPKLINKETKRIHTSFNQTIAATGRLSSSDPNLQNIPIRTPLGRKVRGAFVAEKGFKLVSIDYSQIELRIAAHVSGDQKMLKVFKQGGDIHEATAKEIGVNRRQAKVINFGILYGLSAYGLTSRIPEISQVEANKFIEAYKEAYSTLVDYLDQIVEETKEKGFVQNELGRIRNLPEINSSQFQVRAAAERAAINMPLQSLAADIIKIAMNNLRVEDLTNRQDCRLLIQVHDELLFEILENKVETYVKKIMKIMESAYKLKVPLLVEAKAGNDWEKMNSLDLQ